MATHSSVLAWRVPMNRGAWWATVHGVTKSRRTVKHSPAHTRGWAFYGVLVVKNPAANAGGVRDGVTLGGEDPLGKEMATHSGILAWRSLAGYSP